MNRIDLVEHLAERLADTLAAHVAARVSAAEAGRISAGDLAVTAVELDRLQDRIAALVGQVDAALTATPKEESA